MNIDDLLAVDPFSLRESQKKNLLEPLVHDAARWHYKNSKEFRKICEMHNFDVFSDFTISELPFLPVSLFKKFDLLSVPKKNVIKTLYSSSTSGHPSRIFLDGITSSNQVKALSKILGDFFGHERRHLIIFDAEATVKSDNGTLTSRNTAIRGVLGLARKIDFVFDRELLLSFPKLKKILSGLGKNEKVCFFGFTWLAYNFCLDYQDDSKVRKAFQSIQSQDKLFLHIGGWKKLQDLNVTNDMFKDIVKRVVNVPKNRIVDFYGMTEQLGTIYPDCPHGFKHVPVYADLIVRDIESAHPASRGKAGLIQFVSPIAHSYPGISILSDDIGRIAGVDDCKCGRLGKYFVFEKRAEFAELRGCGDTLDIKNES